MTLLIAIYAAAIDRPLPLFVDIPGFRRLFGAGQLAYRWCHLGPG